MENRFKEQTQMHDSFLFAAVLVTPSGVNQ